MTDEIAQNMQAAETMLRAQAVAVGMPYEEFVATLAAGPTSTHGGGTTLPGFFPQWVAGMNLSRRTRTTYRNAVRPLVTGMLLEHRTRPARQADTRVFPWDDDKVARWLRLAAQVDDELGLGLAIPTAETCGRTDDGSAVLWNGLGDVPLSRLTGSQVAVAARWYRLRAVTNGRAKTNPIASDGFRAVTGMLDALRNLLRAAAADKVFVGTDPTLLERGRAVGGIAPDQRHTTEHRKVLSAHELREVERVWCFDGDDPELDSWLFHYHRLTGSRRGGALNLRLKLLDVESQLVYPPDKDSAASRGRRNDDGAVPVPRALVEGLERFARSRGADGPEDEVFRNNDGTAISPRRYDTISSRCKKQLPFVQEMDRFGSHHLRSTSAAEVEAAAATRGRAVKQRFLRHRPNGQTDVYGRATLEELAAAMVVWTGQSHPLAPRV